MRRRDVLALLGSIAFAWPLAARAQQTAKIRRILWVSTELQPDPFVDGFREGLRERGYVEGKDVVLELRYSPGDPDALRIVLAELTRGKVDLAVSSGPAIRAMRAATEVPVLFAISGDPVQIGLVKSLARPGGNFTGITFLSLDLAAKRVDLLKDIFPKLRKLAVLSNTDHPGEPANGCYSTGSPKAEHRPGLRSVRGRTGIGQSARHRRHCTRGRDASVPRRRHYGASGQGCAICHRSKAAIDVRLERVLRCRWALELRS